MSKWRIVIYRSELRVAVIEAESAKDAEQIFLSSQQDGKFVRVTKQKLIHAKKLNTHGR